MQNCDIGVSWISFCLEAECNIAEKRFPHLDTELIPFGVQVEFVVQSNLWYSLMQ